MKEAQIQGERYDAERALEGSILRCAETHAEGIATEDLMDLVRDIVNAADRCREAGTTRQGITNIVEDSFGAHFDKGQRHGNANKSAATATEASA